MQREGIEGAFGGVSEPLEDARRHEGHEPLTVRRQFMEFVFTPARGQRVAPDGCVRREILGAQQRAVPFRVGHDAGGEFAPIEGFAAALDDSFDRLGLLRAAKAFTGVRGSSAGSEGLSPGGKRRKALGRSGPRCGGEGGHDETVAGETNRPLGEGGQFHAAESFVQRDPAGDRAGNRYGIPSEDRHAFTVVVDIRRPRGRRSARGVDSVEGAVHPDHCEGVGSDAVGTGFDHRQCDCGCNRGIDRIAAALEDPEPHGHGIRLAGGDHVRADRRLHQSSIACLIHPPQITMSSS